MKLVIPLGVPSGLVVGSNVTVNSVNPNLLFGPTPLEMTGVTLSTLSGIEGSPLVVS